jgi:hypothetical protein
MNYNNYKILSIYELNNILCINDELCKSLQIECFNSDEYIKNLYKKEYIDDLSRLQILPWNKNIDHWLNIEDSELLKKTIADYFTLNNDRSKFEIKNKIQDVDFLLD